MKVDREQILRDGFLILRNVVPPDELEEMRRSYATLVERQGGDEWLGQGGQPRLTADRLINESTANAVELWLSDTTLGVAEQLMCNPDPAVMSMWCMCSPLTDHGPAGWHRDIHPIDMAPMDLLQKDMLSNGPRYLQWNIPLYDDSVLWVVPGSHRRLNTPEENAALQKDGRAPLPNSVPVEMNGGDGVVYINFILHWGSNYSTKMRRTLHGGHSIFTHRQDSSFTRHLSPSGQGLFARFDDQSASKRDLTETALRAAIDRDVDAYWAAVEGLQPGADDNGKLVLTIYLSKAAYHAWMLHHPDDDTAPDAARNRANSTHSISLNWGPKFSERFSVSESEALWQRFTPLDRALQSDEEQFVPGYQSGRMMYYFEEALEGYRLEDFISSWEDAS